MLYYICQRKEIMASFMSNVNTLSKQFLRNIFNPVIGSFRWVSETGTCRPQRVNHGKPCRKGWKVADGSIVRRSALLYNQIKLKVYPGLNVGIGRIAKLYAKVPGKVVITCEKSNLDPDNYLVRRNFPQYYPPYVQHVNVIPEPDHQRFKLVEKF